jgi:hypothetical protein
MLVRPDNRAVHVVDVPIDLTGGIGLRLDLGKDAVPEAGLTPTVEAAGDGGPGTVALGQVPPRGASAQNPQNAVDDLAMISRRTASPGFLWQKWLQPLPLFVG